MLLIKICNVQDFHIGGKLNLEFSPGDSTSLRSLSLNMLNSPKESIGSERLLVFSCKIRDFCPSCQAKRREELIFTAERPPPPQVVQQELLMIYLLCCVSRWKSREIVRDLWRASKANSNIYTPGNLAYTITRQKRVLIVQQTWSRSKRYNLKMKKNHPAVSRVSS